MINNSKTYLNHSSFSLLKNWSVQYLLKETFLYNENFNLFPIGKFLIKNRDKVLIENGKEYKRVTVKINNKGVILRNIEKGENIGTKQQYLIRSSQFIMSKIDARNGAFGLVPNNLNGAIVTNDFPVFNVDGKVINPEFLVLLTGTKEFVKFAQSCSSGTTNRQRININLFLNVKIPLPSLVEQNRIVDAYNNKINLAEKQEEQASKKEQEIEEYLFEALGITKQNQLIKNKKFRMIHFKDIDRWDVWINQELCISNKYKNTKLQSVVINKPVYGANVKGVKKITETRYIRITDINETGSLNNAFVSPEFIEEKFLLKEDDFLIARSGNTVGKTFLYKEKFGRAIFAGYLVKYNLDTTKVLPEYILCFTKSYAYKKWIESNQRISGQPNINAQEFLQSPIVLPPFKIQTEIVETIDKMKAEIRKLKVQTENNRQQAIKDFEKEIFC